MNERRWHVAPYLAAVLLLLPLGYLGSYFALVLPAGRMPVADSSCFGMAFGRVYHYRVDGDWARHIFWPLEQIDRKARPTAWLLPWERAGSSSGRQFNRLELP